MRILTFTTLFPNRERPNNAVFIQHRMAAVNRFCDAEVRVVAPVPWYPELPLGSKRYRRLARVPQQEKIAGLEVVHPRYLVTPKIGMSLYGLFMFLGVLPVVRRIYQQWPFDIIDAHYVYPDGLAAILLGRAFNCPVVVSARGTDINLYPRFRLIRPLIRQVLARADGLISVCRSLADVMIGLGTDPRKVKVIPNGIDPLLFYPMPQQKARRKLGLDEEGKILLTVGSLIERKGIHLLIEALAILQKQGELNFNTYIVGNGEERNRLAAQIKAAGLQEQTKLIGEIDNQELVMWYNAADLFFLGSSREGWPNVVSESLACGTPVVATKVDGIPDIVCSPDLGVIVERDVRSFVDALRGAFQRQWNRDRIYLHGQGRTWQNVATEVFEFLQLVYEQSKTNEQK